MATGSQADGLSASYAQGSRDGKAETVKLVLSHTDRIGVLLEHASAAVVSGNAVDAAHFIGNGRQVLSNLDTLLRR